MYKRRKNKIKKDQEYKYTDADVDRIVRQKLNRWRKKRKSEMAAFEEEKNSTSSYKEAAKIFLSHHLPFDMDVIECVTNENIDVTRKNAQAIVNFVFSVKKGKTDIR